MRGVAPSWRQTADDAETQVKEGVNPASNLDNISLGKRDYRCRAALFGVGQRMRTVLMRALIAHYTGGQELESRKIFKEVQE